MKLPKPAQIGKAIAALVGVAAQLVALGVLHGTALYVVSGFIAVATVSGVYRVPNRPTP